MKSIGKCRQTGRLHLADDGVGCCGFAGLKGEKGKAFKSIVD